MPLIGGLVLYLIMSLSQIVFHAKIKPKKRQVIYDIGLTHLYPFNIFIGGLVLYMIMPLSQIVSMQGKSQRKVKIYMIQD